MAPPDSFAPLPAARNRHFRSPLLSDPDRSYESAVRRRRQKEYRMSIPLKLGVIEQQHLQELYEAAGVPREELPYSAELSRVCREFQDRTFKNANEAQVYGALVKYVRAGRRPVGAKTRAPAPPPERVEQAKLLKAQRPGGPRLEPYTAAFDRARESFARTAPAALPPQEFWHVVRLAGAHASRAKPRLAAEPEPVGT
jgi:hypothetical protein